MYFQHKREHKAADAEKSIYKGKTLILEKGKDSKMDSKLESNSLDLKLNSSNSTAETATMKMETENHKVETTNSKEGRKNSEVGTANSKMETTNSKVKSSSDSKPDTATIDNRYKTSGVDNAAFELEQQS